jgi:hypothetical protein
MKNEITLDQARKVLEVVDAGLCKWIGNPVPGQMCVEAAVCFALGQPHGDEPYCVNAAVRWFKIGLNDARWSSNKARAQGMRKLAIAQLGTNDPSFDEKKFVEVLVEQTIRKIVPHALRLAVKTAKGKRKQTLEEAALRCERDGDGAAAGNAREVAANAATKHAAAEAAAAYASCAATKYAAAAAFCASAADGIALNISADIGVQALRAAGAHGIALMDQLIPSE